MSDQSSCLGGPNSAATNRRAVAAERELVESELEQRAELERRCAELEAQNRALRALMEREGPIRRAETPSASEPEACMRRLLSHVGYGMMLVDASGRVRELDAVAARIFGLPAGELIGRRLERLLTRMPDALLRGATSRWEGRTSEGDGYVEIGVGPSSETGDVPLVIRDVTRRHDVERELRRAQRLDAMGRLSAGIAHDMNNVLMAIVGSADRARRRVDQRDFVLERIDEIRGVAEGGAAVVRRLTAFARDGDPRSVVALDAVVRDVAAMLRPVLGEDVDLAVVLDAGGMYVPCDAGRLEQVLVNLAVNARDAMPGGGRLEVSTTRDSPDTVRLEVRDTGCGIEPAIVRRLFEPFFTTKDDGTGLGLSVVRSIVSECGGWVEVGSTPGFGTSVVVELPQAPGAPELRAVWTAPEVSPKTVLVVEDDPLVRAAAREFLERAGHHVLEASSVDAALARCEQTAVDAVVTDVILRGEDGVRLAEEIRSRHPAVRVLYVSGYAHHELVRRGRMARDAFVLPKPYSERELCAALGGLFAPAI